MLLEGKTAIVTGASGGIGKAVAIALAKEGAAVAVHFHGNEEKALLVKKEIEEVGGKAEIFRANVADFEECNALVKAVAKTFGSIDILVNNAGVVEYSSGLHDHTTAQWDKVLDTDLKGVFLMAREVSTIMMKQKYGRIINISSVGGIQAGPAQVSYFAAKGGVVNLTKAMAGDLAPYGILVNAIAPGVYDTEMTHDALDAPGSLVLKNRVALKRFGREGEMNGALIYFASDACTYTTGQLLVIDGGMTSML